MARNTNLHKAKKEANNEFYTQLSDIEKELSHYKDHFKDKIIYCNCDDHKWSNFFRYFSLNFEFLGLKKLIATHFDAEGISYKLEITADINGDGKINHLDTTETPLKQNGDFRSPEAIELLKEADIVVTNPPFSLFREFIGQLMEYDKKFLVIGTLNMIGYKENFTHILNDKLWLGISAPKQFIEPDKNIKKFGNICWFTNLEHKKRNEEIILYKEYNELEYPKYDNCDAINVDKTKDIPCDYNGIIGVPLTFMNNFNPNQFKIVGFRKGNDGKDLKINGRDIFSRILIKNKQL